MKMSPDNPPQGTEKPLTLGRRLATLFENGFFRPLGRPSAPLYIDCLERLTTSADESGQIAHDEALLLIRDVLNDYPRIELDEDEGAYLSDLRQRAGQIFNRMIDAKWLHTRRVNLDERWVLLSPRTRPLLRALGEIAADNVADLRDFAATVRSVCETLLADGVLDPSRRQPEEFREVVTELLARVGRAGDQMLAVENLILDYEERQRTSSAPGETLQRFLVDFHEGEHLACYDTLERGGLLLKLKQARAVVQTALANPFAKQRLAEGIRAHSGLDDSAAYTEAEHLLGLLERRVAGIPAKQRSVDGRIADFSRLSAQRYRYQTEMRGRRPEQIKAYMEVANEAEADRSFSSLASASGMELLSPEVEVYFGMASLSLPRKVRPPVDLSFDATPVPADAEEAQEMIRRRNLYVITPLRAGRLIEAYLPEKNMRVSTADLKLSTEDDLLDLLAVLAYERSASVSTHRPIKWSIHPERLEKGLNPESIGRDQQAGRQVERLTIERIQ
jgi:hypothetical protein